MNFMIFYGGEYATELCSEKERGGRMRRKNISVRAALLADRAHHYYDMPDRKDKKISS